MRPARGGFLHTGENPGSGHPYPTTYYIGKKKKYTQYHPFCGVSPIFSGCAKCERIRAETVAVQES
jgi:hypothetical protein